MDGLVVIWGVTSFGLGIALLFLWRDSRPSEDEWKDVARRLREMEQREDGEDK